MDFLNTLEGLNSPPNSDFDLVQNEEQREQREECYCFPEPVSKPFRVKKEIPDFSNPAYLALLRNSEAYATIRLVSRRKSSSISSRSSSDRMTRSLTENASSSSSCSSRSRKTSVESDDSNRVDVMATSHYESDFWTPSFFKKSYDEEALPANERSFSKQEESLRKKIYSSLASLSPQKYREKHWFCYTCKTPRDRCNCVCTIS